MKKVLSILLAAALMLTLIPATIFAANPVSKWNDGGLTIGFDDISGGYTTPDITYGAEGAVINVEVDTSKINTKNIDDSVKAAILAQNSGAGAQAGVFYGKTTLAGVTDAYPDATIKEMQNGWESFAAVPAANCTEETADSSLTENWPALGRVKVFKDGEWKSMSACGITSGVGTSIEDEIRAALGKTNGEELVYGTDYYFAIYYDYTFYFKTYFMDASRSIVGTEQYKIVFSVKSESDKWNDGGLTIGFDDICGGFTTSDITYGAEGALIDVEVDTSKINSKNIDSSVKTAILAQNSSTNAQAGVFYGQTSLAGLADAYPGASSKDMESSYVSFADVGAVNTDGDSSLTENWPALGRVKVFKGGEWKSVSACGVTSGANKSIEDEIREALGKTNGEALVYGTDYYFAIYYDYSFYFKTYLMDADKNVIGTEQYKIVFSAKHETGKWNGGGLTIGFDDILGGFATPTVTYGFEGAVIDVEVDTNKINTARIDETIKAEILRQNSSTGAQAGAIYVQTTLSGVDDAYPAAVKKDTENDWTSFANVSDVNLSGDSYIDKQWPPIGRAQVNKGTVQTPDWKNVSELVTSGSNKTIEQEIREALGKTNGETITYGTDYRFKLYNGYTSYFKVYFLDADDNVVGTEQYKIAFNAKHETGKWNDGGLTIGFDDILGGFATPTVTYGSEGAVIDVEVDTNKINSARIDETIKAEILEQNSSTGAQAGAIYVQTTLSGVDDAYPAAVKKDTENDWTSFANVSDVNLSGDSKAKRAARRSAPYSATVRRSRRAVRKLIQSAMIPLHGK